ncbi:MAG: hypothetical protein ACRDGA_05465 [Bacteroidota bacterium]
MREAITHTFQDAQTEYIPNAAVLDSPVRPHVFVSQIRQGSLDFQVIYQGLIDLPWHEIIQTAGDITNQGLVIIERVGAIIAGVETLRRIGPWIQKRIRGGAEVQSQDADSTVAVRQESSLRADPNAFSNNNTAGEIVGELLHDPTPRAILVQLDEQSITIVRRTLRISVEEHRHHLGGPTIIHDMNLMMNGLSNLDDLREGDPFCLHNPSAIGMHVVHDEDSLFDACVDPNSDLRIEELMMDHMDFPEKTQIVEGPSLDIEDLPE